MTLKFYIDKGILKVKYDFFLWVNSLKKNNKIAELNFSELKFPVYLRKKTSDISTFFQIFYYKGYNINFNFEPKVIFDCGANVGLASVYFKNRYPNARIIAVEPESSNFEMLLKNTEKYKDIECIKAGIWNKTTNLRIIDSGQGNWGFVTEETDKEGPDTVKAISIDELMKKYNVDHIDILKIDIESSEKELFEKNFENWLPKSKVVLVELHDQMKEGCTRSFFKAMVNYKFTMSCKGENIVCKLL
jgi:FkbM family methyltransferase